MPGPGDIEPASLSVPEALREIAADLAEAYKRFSRGLDKWIDGTQDASAINLGLRSWNGRQQQSPG